MKYSLCKGFTITELVVVITVIGLLAAMALPKFGSLAPSAADANASSIAGALGAAAANNNARCNTGLSCTTVTGPNCSQATLAALLTGITSTDYTVGGTLAGGCTIRHNSGTTTYTSASLN